MPRLQKKDTQTELESPQAQSEQLSKKPHCVGVLTSSFVLLYK